MYTKVKFIPTIFVGSQEDLDEELVKKLTQYMESQISVSTASMMGVDTDCKTPEYMTFTYEDSEKATTIIASLQEEHADKEDYTQEVEDFIRELCNWKEPDHDDFQWDHMHSLSPVILGEPFVVNGGTL